MTRAEFWASQCPVRGAGLEHAHWNKCDPKGYHPGTADSHTFEQCCHCLRTHDTVDVHDEAVAPDPDGVLVEPKHITGLGPQGNPKGRARGPLTGSDEARLKFYVIEVRRDGYNHP